jgi:hypothetical protein
MADYAEPHAIVGQNGSGVYVEDSGMRTNTRSDFDQAVIDGRAFSWMSQTYDPDAHDTILGVENNSTTHVLKIHKVFVWSDTASAIQVFTISGKTMTGTAVPGTNLNRASGRIAEATAKADETGNAEQAAGYTQHLLHKQIAANALNILDIDGAIVLPNDFLVGVDLTTAATAANVTIFGWFEEM